MVAVAGMGDLARAAPFLGALCSPDIIARLVDEKQRGKEAWAETAPAAMAPLAVPVTMILGLYDPVASPAHARRFALAAGSRGGPSVTLLNLNEAGHFELIAPWTPAGAATVHAILGVDASGLFAGGRDDDRGHNFQRRQIGFISGSCLLACATVGSKRYSTWPPVALTIL